MAALGRLVLLEAVKVECMAALLEGNSSLVVWIKHVIKLQVLHDHLVPRYVRILFGNESALSCIRCQTRGR